MQVTDHTGELPRTRLVVDLATNTGPLRYGATGFLYGLGDEGIPNETMLAALAPRVAAQMAPDGRQHPNGDALRVAPMLLRAGGGEVQIYLQDIYEQWPYEHLGLDDYLARLDRMVQQVVADPHRSSYVHVPFNEPDQIWYSGNLNQLLADWRVVHQRIRSIDPGARIAGPNFASYRPDDMRQFMTDAWNHGVLPDVVTWHELGDDFFTAWYDHFDHYRGIEASLGISQRPININEYGRFSGDLGVPGNLVQYLARFENSKVDGALAYWTTAGSLNDLVTRNNQATGGWWLYKWYGELTGHTVAVAPPSRDSPLQGLAALDPAKRQARVILGGNHPASGTYDTTLVVRGLSADSGFGGGGGVYVTVWGVDDSGRDPSPGPYVVTEGSYPVHPVYPVYPVVVEDQHPASGGQVTIALSGLRGTSAYHVIVTPDPARSPVGPASRYQAEYARLGGTARVAYGTSTGHCGTAFVEGYAASTTASTTFVVSVPDDGYYQVGLRYSAGPYPGAPDHRSIRVMLNRAYLTDLALPGTADWDTWNLTTARVFLPAGISQVEFRACATDDRDAINIDCLDLTPTTGTVATYRGEPDGNTLRFHNVTVPSSGRYRMVVVYANAERRAGHPYNTDIIDRGADISVNGGTPTRVYFRNTFSWTTFHTAVVDVDLTAGANTITFTNPPSGYAPDIDLIRIAAPLG